MTGLATIENGSLISLILAEVDGTYGEFHRQLYHQSRIELWIQREDYNLFNQIV